MRELLPISQEGAWGVLFIVIGADTLSLFHIYVDIFVFQERRHRNGLPACWLFFFFFFFSWGEAGGCQCRFLPSVFFFKHACPIARVLFRLLVNYAKVDTKWGERKQRILKMLRYVCKEGILSVGWLALPSPARDPHSMIFPSVYLQLHQQASLPWHLHQKKKMLTQGKLMPVSLCTNH